MRNKVDEFRKVLGLNQEEFAKEQLYENTWGYDYEFYCVRCGMYTVKGSNDTTLKQQGGGSFADDRQTCGKG